MICFAIHKRAWLLFLCVVFPAMSAMAQQNGKEQVWTFQGQGGTIKVRASQSAENLEHPPITVLNLWVDKGTSDLQEEARFLSQALDRLPGAGFELSTLSLALFRFDQPEAERRVALAAAISTEWNSISRSKNPSIIYPMAARILNTSGAFREWTEVFRVHGIDTEVAGVEKLAMASFRDTGASCPPRTDCSRVLVPSFAFIEMSLKPVCHN